MQTTWSSWCKTDSVRCSLFEFSTQDLHLWTENKIVIYFTPGFGVATSQGRSEQWSQQRASLTSFMVETQIRKVTKPNRRSHIFLRAVIDWNYYQQSKHLILKGRSVSKLVCKSVSLLLFLTHRLRSFKACVLPYSGPTCTRVQRRHFRFLPICHLSIWNFSTWRIFLHRYLGGIGDKY